MARRIPKKLKEDGIIEALFEVQFRCNELPEIAVGRLSDYDAWQHLKPEQLPAANIPNAIRATDPNLKFQPILELRGTDGKRRVRVGGSVVSYHLSGKNSYCGWNEYEPQLDKMVGFLFEKLTAVTVTRLGFRYVNALTPLKHLISSVNALDIGILVGGAPIDGPANLNYQITNDASHVTMTRIASPSFVHGVLPSETSVVIDIDVATPDGLVIKSAADVLTWTKSAHAFEKEAFFRLVPENILEQIVEEW